MPRHTREGKKRKIKIAFVACSKFKYSQKKMFVSNKQQPFAKIAAFLTLSGWFNKSHEKRERNTQIPNSSHNEIIIPWNHENFSLAMSTILRRGSTHTNTHSLTQIHRIPDTINLSINFAYNGKIVNVQRMID